MANELLFRVLFAILWIIFISNLTWIRLSVREPKNKSAKRHNTIVASKLHVIALAMFAPFWFGGIILYILIPNWIMFLSIQLPNWFRFIMSGMAALGLLFALWGYRALGKNWVHALEPSTFTQRKEGTLVTIGPYHYVRNPIYLGAFTFILSMSLLAANWLLLLPSLVLISVIYAQIPNEEHMLIDKFGNRYREYMKRTPKFIPKLPYKKSHERRR